MPNLAGLSGQMHAAAEYSNAYTAAQLDQMKQQQKTAAGAQGMAAADFDAAFSQSYTATKAQGDFGDAPAVVATLSSPTRPPLPDVSSHARTSRSPSAFPSWRRGADHLVAGWPGRPRRPANRLTGNTARRRPDRAGTGQRRGR
ncbi:hypothetical protein G6F31_019426 [Rhizopus arrhizus]|nr:hypothetical protein G6F31_019426 [Rhizopus arrhizus]